MKQYLAHIEYNHGYGEVTIEAETPELAMRKAQELTDADVSYCGHYEVGAEFEHIRITDEEDDAVCVEWTDEEVAQRAHGVELYTNMKLAISALNQVKNSPLNILGHKNTYSLVADLEKLVKQIDARSADAYEVLQAAEREANLAGEYDSYFTEMEKSQRLPLSFHAWKLSEGK